MSDNRYFSSMYQDRRMLEQHGFDAWPSSEELARYAFGLEEKIDTLAEIAGISLERDVRGRLRVGRAKGVL